MEKSISVSDIISPASFNISWGYSRRKGGGKGVIKNDDVRGKFTRTS